MIVKIVSQKTLLKAHHFVVKENTIDFGNQVIKVHSDIYRKSAVSILPITDNGEIYLIKQYRYLHDKEIIELIAGMVEEGESVLETAKRELKEEGGIVADELKELKKILIAGSMIKADQYFVVAQGLHRENPEPEDTESIRVIKVTIKEAVEKVISGEICTASSVTGILLLDKLMQQGML